MSLKGLGDVLIAGAIVIAVIVALWGFIGSYIVAMIWDVIGLIALCLFFVLLALLLMKYGGNGGNIGGKSNPYN